MDPMIVTDDDSSMYPDGKYSQLLCFGQNDQGRANMRDDNKKYDNKKYDDCCRSKKNFF